MMIGNLLVGKWYFNVIFQFSRETRGLDAVLIQHDSDDVSHFPSKIVSDSIHLLSEKYGTPNRIGTSEDWRWAFKTTTIDLSALYIENIVSTVSIHFFPTISAIANKRKNSPAF